MRRDNIFKYTAINLQGDKKVGEYNGYNISDLRESLKEKGYYLLESREKKNIFTDIFKIRATSLEISILCSSLGNMIGAGISVPQTLRIISAQCSREKFSKSLKSIEHSVLKGESIYGSLRKSSNIYPQFLIEMIHIGEDSGMLDRILIDLSRFYYKQSILLSKIKGATIYPITVLVSSLFIITFLMTRIVPKFIDTLIAFGGNIPYSTQIMMDSYSFLKEHFYEINIISLIFIFIVYKFSKTKEGKFYFDKLKIRAPILRKIYTGLILSRFSISLSMLISSGYNVVKALEVTESIIDNKFIELKLSNSIKEIKSGKSLHDAFKRQGFGDELFIAFIDIGENTGKLEEMLLKLGEIFEVQLEEYLKKVLNLMEPMVIIFLALFVGLFIISAFMPTITIMDSIA